MSTTKIIKHQYWQDQIKAWQASQLSQSAYCSQSGIKLSTFTYWRRMLSKPEDKRTNKFASIKVVKDKMAIHVSQAVQIKLLTGHMVHLPIEIGTDEIAKLIHLLGLPHA